MKTRSIIYAAAVLVCLLLTNACREPGGDNGTDVPGTITDPVLINLLDPDPIPLPGTTSFDKIDDAFTKGSIDETEAMRLRIIAGFDPGKLSAAYTADAVAERSSLQAADRWLGKNWDSLSADLQEELRPYYVLPDDADSYLGAAAARKARITPLNTPTGWPYISVSIAAQPEATPALAARGARIHYESSSDTAARQQAQWLAEAFEDAYPRFVALLNRNVDQDVYVYVHPRITDKGVADMRVINGAMRGRIYVRKGMNEQLSKAVLAHELFHVFQDYVGLDYSPDDEQWLMEATAAWAEHYIYPDYNTEHEYLPQFFSNLDQSMISGGSTGYTTYPWFLFVTQMLHYEGYVSDMLHDAVSQTATSAVTEKPYFEAYFGQYALWNWNQDPARNYRDNPSFPGDPRGGESYDSVLYEQNRQYTGNIFVGPLAMLYNAMVISDSVDKIKFEFDAPSTAGKRRQALVLINGAWTIEDWTGITERTFCRNRDEDRVDAVVLIASNAGTTDDYNENFRVDTRGRCLPSWHGTTQVTSYYHFQESGTELTISGDFTVHTVDSNYTFVTRDELVQDEDGNLRVQRQFASYHGTKNEEINYSRSCGWLWELEREDSWGSVSIDHTGDDSQPVRWEMTLNDLGIPVALELNVTAGSTEDWITRHVHKAHTIAHCVITHYIEYNTDDEWHYSSNYSLKGIDVPTDNMTALRIEGVALIPGEDCTSCGKTVYYSYSYD